MTTATSPRTVLVFRSAALGDFVLASPALRMVRQTWPDARVVLLTMQSSIAAIRASVAQYSPGKPLPWVEFARPHLIDDVVLLDHHASLSGLLRLRRLLRQQHVDQGVLLVDPGAPWPGRIKKLLLLRFLLGGVPLAGWRHPASLAGNRAKWHAKGMLPHHVWGLMQFLRELRPPRPITENDVRFDLRLPADAEQWADQLWAEHGLAQGPGPVLAFAPGSIQPHKRWPLEKFLALGRALLAEQPGARLLVVGTPFDAELGQAVSQAFGERVLNLVGKTGVSQLGALLKRCDLLVGNDGGSMHLGDAMGCKVVSIVPGIQYPDSIEPWNHRAFAVRHPVGCAPCYDFLKCPLGHNRCMVDLPVEAVLTTCRRLLTPTGVLQPTMNTPGLA